MRSDYTDITLVIDRSGSMAMTKSDAEGGVNAFVAKQKSQPGKATLTLVQFDDVYEFVHRGVPVADVPPYKLEPSGSTALLDAVGRAVTETGSRLAAMPESERPGLVVFVIVTDGEENASREFTRENVRAMIQHQTDVYKWQFTFIGANQDAITSASSIGIAASSALNYAEKNTGQAFLNAGEYVLRMASAVASGCTPVAAYTDEERASSVD